jgi:osmoprotectant transport system permease protein
MRENIVAQLEVLPDYLGGHLQITLIPLLLGIAISLPLAIVAVKVKSLRTPVMMTVAVIQTIPGLALLALTVPVLVLVGEIVAPFGITISALGFLPAVIALTLYSMLPIVRNTVTGITGVEPALTEAARGLGMTEWQTLTRVELPLAAPVIVAGIRTATVWVVGIATLATPVGQTSLGNYIFSGLQTRNHIAVLFGCIGAAALALFLDGLIGLVERSVRDRRRGPGIVAAIGLCAVGVASIALPNLRRPSAGVDVVYVGAKTFTEQYILASAIEGVLTRAGFEARRREGLGSTVIFDALASGEIDVYVDYSGTIWTNHMGRKDGGDSATVLREMTAWLQQERGITCLGALGFENAYAIAMRSDRAKEMGATTIADLAPSAATLTIGGDYEFFGRPEWAAVRDGYGLHGVTQRSFDSTFMYEAVAAGEVDAISAFSSDGRIAAFDLVTLEDPKNVLPPYDAVLLVSEDAAARPGFLDALRPLVGAIELDAMRRANHAVDGEGRTPEAAAQLLR